MRTSLLILILLSTCCHGQTDSERYAQAKAELDELYRKVEAKTAEVLALADSLITDEPTPAPKRPELFIREPGETYGDGSGRDFENAIAGLEFIENRPAPNTVIHVYGEQTKDSSYWYPEKLWNDGVTLRGHDCVISPRIRIWPLYGHDHITIEGVKAVATFRDWEWSYRNRVVDNPEPAHRSHHVTIRNSTFDCPGVIGWTLSTGNDHWLFENVTATGGKHGIVYAANIKTNGGGPKHLTIRGCDFSRVNTGDDKKGWDGHAIGLQRCENVLVEDCTIRHTYGAAIEAWLGKGMQRNIVIRNNDIRDIRVGGFTDPRGIAFSSDNRKQELDNRTGCSITGNTIRDTDSSCVSIGVQDPVEVSDNDLHQPRKDDQPLFNSFHFGPEPQIPRNNRIYQYRDTMRLAMIRYGSDSKFGKWDGDSNTVEIIQSTDPLRN